MGVVEREIVCTFRFSNPVHFIFRASIHKHSYSTAFLDYALRLLQLLTMFCTEDHLIYY